MKERSSSNSNREDRMRSSTSRPYSNYSSSKEGRSFGQYKQEQMSSRRAKSVNMTSPFEPLEEFRETPWMNIFKKESTYNGPEHRLHHEILAYLTYMQQTPDEKRARELVMTGIRRVVHGRFYGAEIRLYGSSATGLCLPTSDIDVAIKLPRITEADVKRTLFQLSSQFRSAALTSNVFVNHHAKVPILILGTRDEYGSLNVDININDESGTRGVEVINGYLAQMPALRPLVLLLKGFLHQKRLNDAPRGGLGSYALVCLCIHFLQANPSNRPQEYIDKPMESESLGFLLIDFMFYYGLTFDYATSYISSATSPGRLLPKTEENEVLSIRCLFNPENEIAKSVNKVRAFFQVFKDAYSTLLQLNLMDQTMLGQIIRLDQKFIDQRVLLSRVALSTDRTSTHRVHHGHHPNHSLPPRPPSGNLSRATRTWKDRPVGSNRMQYHLSVA
ncbi:hypothetical protein H2248_001552 [Termitomyces sp. 'cryptogamus']|nr:hypothetical protein H2248_001552 [Termitomyces sp. 'cryptogamus']